ncbi:hypothetical protein NDU88_005618 [Pleurodeles waltl]|uniref:Uncharacterized protein n=1 Tax=Pleurodeles waltl TaxID=8319 RepID=A0AAV7VNQ1_PLEWA|nr:hypothetical protein NDU88_005618 [Pleurodeles waltl]
MWPSGRGGARSPEDRAGLREETRRDDTNPEAAGYVGRKKEEHRRQRKQKGLVNKPAKFPQKLAANHDHTAS